MPDTNTAQPTIDIPAVVYPRMWSLVAVVLETIARAGLLVVPAFLLLSADASSNPLKLLRFVAGFSLLPGAAAWVLRWFFAASASVETDALILEQRHQRVEIPLGSIREIEPWGLPLPGKGLWLRLKSGRRFRAGLQVDNPATLIEALADAGGGGSLREMAQHPAIVYVCAKGEARSRRRYRALLKFPIFALVPTLPLFRVHQYIAYGGTFGEYYQYGLGAYLSGFAIYWATLTVYLLIYAAVLRTPTEIIAMVAARFLPRRAYTVRKLAERAHAVLYYGGVPAVVILRFIPW